MFPDFDLITEFCVKELQQQRFKPTNEYFGFKAGLCGLAVHALILHMQTQQAELKEYAAYWINHGIEGIFANPRQNRFVGMESAEIPLVLDFVLGNGLLDFESLYSIGELDEFILTTVKIKITQANFDTCSGVLAEGFYLISKQSKTDSDRRTLALIINALKTFIERASDKKFFLGVSHGLSGKILFLNRCIRNNIEAESCMTIVRLIVAKILSYHISDGSFAFPFQIGKNPEGSLNCWSYGSPGIIYALFDVMDISTDLIEAAFVQNAIARIIRQIGIEFQENSDPGIWYGRAGLLTFLDIIHWRTGNTMAGEIAREVFSFNMQHFLSDLRKLDKVRDVDYKTTFIHGMPGMYQALALHQNPEKFEPFSNLIFF